MRKSALVFFGLVVASLVALGLVVLSSASVANAQRLHGDQLFFMKRQFLYLGVGMVALIATAWFDYRNLRHHAWLVILAYVGVFILLLAVFAYNPINGSHRWISLGPVRLQPSEFAKILTVLTLSLWMDSLGWRVELFFKGAFWPGILIALLAAPIVFEPDYGSALILCGAGFLIMWVAGSRLGHVVILAVLGLSLIGALIVSNPNRMRRLQGYFNPTVTEESATTPAQRDPAAHQGAMSLVAIRNGHIWGVGLGESMQKHLYLPEAHTDFIFAVGAEELGLGFSVAVIVLFFLFFIMSLYIARKSTDRFGRYIVIGMSTLIFFQAMANLGVVSEALPTKGLALPFFSYGGTNLVGSFIAVGLILSVGLHSTPTRRERLASKVVMR